MELTFLPLTLDAVDAAGAEALCLFISSDERPLTGLAGLADWRLSGKLSRLLRGGLLTGESGEAVLTPPGSRLGFRKLFLFGIGPAAQSEEGLTQRVVEAIRKLAEAGVREAALQLPARLGAEAGVRTLLAQLQGPARAMVFGPDPQKMVAVLSQVARGQSAPPPQPTQPFAPETVALPMAPEVPAEEPPADGRRPTPPPSQRYVPPPPKPNVFDKSKRKKH